MNWSAVLNIFRLLAAVVNRISGVIKIFLFFRDKSGTIHKLAVGEQSLPTNEGSLLSSALGVISSTVQNGFKPDTFFHRVPNLHDHLIQAVHMKKLL